MTSVDAATLLEAAAEVSSDEVQAALAAGLQTRVIERRRDGMFAFVHNEVREALLAAYDEEGLRDAHQRAADAYAAAGDEVVGRVYALARHSNAGRVADDPARCACR